MFFGIFHQRLLITRKESQRLPSPAMTKRDHHTLPVGRVISIATDTAATAMVPKAIKFTSRLKGADRGGITGKTSSPGSAVPVK
jgi:hypothetical protein